MLLPAMPRDAAPPQAVAFVERLLPSAIKRNIAVIADTVWAVKHTVSPQTANQAIPFFGILMGLASIGHAVWIVELRATELIKIFCRDADVLIVDSDRLPALPADWQTTAASVMREQLILIHDRATHQFRKAQP